MLEIKSISWRNFLSYGDYLTTLDVSNLGQCLITGEVIEKDGVTESLIRKSNGAGKSTIPTLYNGCCSDVRCIRDHLVII
jgi:hypothetical protein